MKNGYYPAEACQNTFLIFDFLTIHSLCDSLKQKALEYLVKEKKDDAMILIDGQEKSDAYYAKMLVLGVDGAFGEFCGNGSRACAAYLFYNYPKYKRFFLVSNRSTHELLRYEDGTYSTQLPKINFELNKKFIGRPELFHKKNDFSSMEFEGKHLIYAEAIEPHLIVEEQISDDELLELGKKINRRADLFPLKINVNAIQTMGQFSIRVRTYERGVQRLTQSCGTGSSCSAAWFLKTRTGTVNVLTLGGTMTITIDSNGLQLKGPANVEKFVSADLK